jgi:hypothetical protein
MPPPRAIIRKTGRTIEEIGAVNLTSIIQRDFCEIGMTGTLSSSSRILGESGEGAHKD